MLGEGTERSPLVSISYNVSVVICTGSILRYHPLCAHSVGMWKGSDAQGSAEADHPVEFLGTVEK